MADRGGGDGDAGGDTLGSWLRSIPPVTRWWFSGSAVVTVCCGVGLVDPRLVVLDWERVRRGLEVWRVLAPFFLLGPLGINVVFDLLFIYRYCSMLEQSSFRGRTADFLWMFVCLGGALLLAARFVVPMAALGPALLSAVIHVWSRHFPNMRVTLFFVTVPAAYLSFALLAMHLLMGGGINYAGLAGVVCGHLYYFLDSVYPLMPGNQGRKLIRTPHMVQRMFPHDRAYVVPGASAAGHPPQQRRQAAGDAAGSGWRGHRWGAGRRLGGDQGRAE